MIYQPKTINIKFGISQFTGIIYVCDAHCTQLHITDNYGSIRIL